jgi:probable F420-dependent oxidoreductase
MSLDCHFEGPVASLPGLGPRRSSMPACRAWSPVLLNGEESKDAALGRRPGPGHMKFIVEYPVVSTPGAGWLEPASITRFARAVGEAGLDGIGFTDHPAPSLKWLNGGGHETFDPFVALGFCAAVTTRIRLLTWLSVVPYRNPFLAAKSMTTVDLVSGGRATFALGSGYLRSEFAALGVDFAERNDLFEESVRVMKATWTGSGVSTEGRHFEAIGQVGRPRPVQRPHPPLWIGGNSAVARDRVARLAQGWAPMRGPKMLARTARTPLRRVLWPLWPARHPRQRGRGHLPAGLRGIERPGLADAGADQLLVAARVHPARGRADDTDRRHGRGEHHQRDLDQPDPEPGAGVRAPRDTGQHHCPRCGADRGHGRDQSRARSPAATGRHPAWPPSRPGRRTDGQAGRYEARHIISEPEGA